MAEYGKNEMTNELAVQYLAELNALSIGDRIEEMANSTCWWPCIADELPHPLAGQDGLSEDATIPDMRYNINATFDEKINKFVNKPVEDKYS